MYESYGILQGIVLNFILFLALIGGGIPSATNARDVQVDYIDRFRCNDDNIIGGRATEEQCDDLEQLRNSQAAAAVSLSC